MHQAYLDRTRLYIVIEFTFNPSTVQKHFGINSTAASCSLPLD